MPADASTTLRQEYVDRETGVPAVDRALDILSIEKTPGWSAMSRDQARDTEYSYFVKHINNINTDLVAEAADFPDAEPGIAEEKYRGCMQQQAAATSISDIAQGIETYVLDSDKLTTQIKDLALSMRRGANTMVWSNTVPNFAGVDQPAGGIIPWITHNINAANDGANATFSTDGQYPTSIRTDGTKRTLTTGMFYDVMNQLSQIGSIPVDEKGIIIAWCNPSMLQSLLGLENISDLQKPSNENTKGGVVTRVATAYGEVHFKHDVDMRDCEIILCDMSSVKKVYLSSKTMYSSEKVARSGFADKYVMRMLWGLKMPHTRRIGAIFDILAETPAILN